MARLRVKFLCGSGILCVLINFFLCAQGYENKFDETGIQPHGKCEAITIPLCKDIEYNQTIMPNLLNHQTQDDAGLEVHQFFPLVKVDCSPYLKFFLCTMYVPVCTVLDEAIPPCRSLCIQARTGCKELMNRFGFEWPETLECSKFPEKGLCVGQNKTSTPRPTHRPDSGGGVLTNNSGNQPSGDLDFECPSDHKVPKGNDYKLQVGDEIVHDCGITCLPEDDLLFSKVQRTFVRYWVGAWALLCMLSTLFTVLTFVIDMQRFRYPERPIIFLSGCYLVLAVTYICGFFLRKYFFIIIFLPTSHHTLTLIAGWKKAFIICHRQNCYLHANANIGGYWVI